VLQAIFAGALAKPEWVLTFSAFFHTIRIFGGTAGAIYMGHFLAQREKLHSNLLGLHVGNGIGSQVRTFMRSPRVFMPNRPAWPLPGLAQSI